jgi:hypothetical protein
VADLRAVEGGATHYKLQDPRAPGGPSRLGFHFHLWGAVTLLTPAPRLSFHHHGTFASTSHPEVDDDTGGGAQCGHHGGLEWIGKEQW